MLDKTIILAVEHNSIKDEAKIVTASYKINYLWRL